MLLLHMEKQQKNDEQQWTTNNKHENVICKLCKYIFICKTLCNYVDEDGRDQSRPQHMFSNGFTTSVVSFNRSSLLEQFPISGGQRHSAMSVFPWESRGTRKLELVETKTHLWALLGLSGGGAKTMTGTSHGLCQSPSLRVTVMAGRGESATVWETS